MADWWGEGDWLGSKNPHHLRALLVRQDSRSTRKHRLAAVACWREVWPELTEACRKVLEVAEDHADGRVKYSELQRVAEACRASELQRPRALVLQVARSAAHREAGAALAYALLELLGFNWNGPSLPRGAPPGFREGRNVLFCSFIRDIFGNPFRPTAADPAWLLWADGTVPNLARSIYDDRAFHRLPLLADALEDAGCADRSILAHCRGPGPHARGCWVIDLLLGKL